jgi:hypothetical protein
VPAGPTIRSPEDLVVAVPYLLGFRPESSLVVVATGGAPPAVRVTMRVDLPTGPDTAACLDEVIPPLLRAGAERVWSMVYPEATERESIARAPRAALVTGLAQRFERAGLDIADLLCVRTTAKGGERYRSYLCSGAGCCPPRGRVVSEAAALRVRSGFVALGRVAYGCRDDLVRSLAALPAYDPAVARLRAAVDRERDRGRPAGGGLGRHRRALATRLDAALRAAAVPGRRLGTAAGGALVVALADVQLRDVLLGAAVREQRLDELVEELASLVRMAGQDDLAPVAATLALAAYLAGHGALAWTAVDRARQHDPSMALAELVAHCLQEGLPPDRLRGFVGALVAVPAWDGGPLRTRSVSALPAWDESPTGDGPRWEGGPAA